MASPLFSAALLALASVPASANVPPPHPSLRVLEEALLSQSGEELTAPNDGIGEFYRRVEERITEHRRTIRYWKTTVNRLRRRHGELAATETHPTQASLDGLSAWLTEARAADDQITRLLGDYAQDIERWTRRLDEYDAEVINATVWNWANWNITGSVSLVRGDINALSAELSNLRRTTTHFQDAICSAPALLERMITVLMESPTTLSGVEIRIYSADWCGPCQWMHRSLHDAGFDERLPVTVGGTSRFVTIVNVDTTNWSSAEARRNGISGYPTIRILVGGAVVRTIDGAVDSAELQRELQAVLAQTPPPHETR